MSTLITFLHVLVCLILVGTVLLQQGKGGGMGGAFGGANAATVFGSGGASTFLRRLTAIAATVFMLTSMVLAYIASNDAGDALKSYSAQQTQLKKRKKDAETRALEGVTGDAGVGTGTGADIDDGDTGEDEVEGDGTAPVPAPVPTDPAAAPSPVTDVEVPAVIEEPAPTTAPATKPAAKPATTPAKPAEKPATAPAKPAEKPRPPSRPPRSPPPRSPPPSR